MLAIAAAGSYALRGSLFDVQLVFVFGVAGYLMMRYGFPPVPLPIGFISWDEMERRW